MEGVNHKTIQRQCDKKVIKKNLAVCI